MSYEADLATVAEGFCPEHRHPLGADGWCPDCGHRGAWWSIRRDEDSPSPAVVTTYPDILTGERPAR